jgi:hypothetical protein
MQRISLLVAALVAACVIYAVVNAAPPAPKYKVVPHDVTKKNPPDHPARSIGGTFTLVEAPDGDPASSVDAEGKPFVTGGACLVYQERRNAMACTTQQQCRDAAPAGGYGYCDSLTEGSPGSCWFKQPSASSGTTIDGYLRDDHCIKSGPAKTLIVDKVNDMPVGPGRPLGNDKKLSWRITTCQGIVAGGCANPNAVQGVDVRTRWGDVLDF